MADSEFSKLLCEDSSHVQDARSCIFEERLSAANAFVDEGNAFFKSESFDLAYSKYLSAGRQADFDVGQQWDMTDEHKSEIRQIKIRILLNFVNCELKRGNFFHATTCASAGLDLCKANVSDDTTVAKLRFRRAKGQIGLKNFAAAAQDLREACKLVPNDLAIRQLLVFATEKAKEARSAADVIWKGKTDLFDSLDSRKYPHVDLIITGDNPTSPVAEQSSFWQQLCCKRRRKDKVT